MDELDEFIPAWDELALRRPMRSPVWLLAWWDVFSQKSQELCIQLFFNDDVLVGLAPLYLDQTGSRRVVRLLGDRGNVCTDHTTWVAKTEFQQPVGRAVADFLRDFSWNRLHFSAVDVDDEAMLATIRQLVTHRFRPHFKRQVSCWTIELPETWDSYLERLSKNHRKRCRRLLRNHLDSGQVIVHTATRNNFSEAWQCLLDLHARRWGDTRRPSGSFSDARFREFHRRVASELLHRGQLRLAYLTKDEQPIAAEYQFFDQDTLYTYQSGMTCDAGIDQPGNLSLIASIQFALQRQLQRIDLLRGDETYKAHWRATATACQDIRIWPNNLPGRFSCQLATACASAEQWWKQTATSSSHPTS